MKQKGIGGLGQSLLQKGDTAVEQKPPMVQHLVLFKIQFSANGLIVGFGPGGLGFESVPWAVRIPFIGGSRNPNHQAPNQQLTIS